MDAGASRYGRWIQQCIGAFVRMLPCCVRRFQFTLIVILHLSRSVSSEELREARSVSCVRPSLNELARRPAWVAATRRACRLVRVSSRLQDDMGDLQKHPTVMYLQV